MSFFSFGAALVAALEKKSVRPLARGCTLCRLAAKCAGISVREEMGELLDPRQLGYGITGGAEAEAHAARIYVESDR